MSTITVFSLETAQSLVNSQDQFPVDFDNLWQWCQFSRKDNAKKFLLETFEIGLDYQSLEIRTVAGGTPRQQINLTIDASKQFAMMAKTEKGKEVRKYFLEVERRFKETQAVPAHKQITPIDVIETLLKLDASALPASVKQLLTDSAVNYHITGNQKAIAPSVEVKTPLGVVEVAERLGYSPNHSTRPSLGRYVSNHCSEFKAGQERRLCNGKMLPINLYQDCAEVEQAIIAFFEGLE